MLHERKPYRIREDGVQLVRSWSDEFMIQKIAASADAPPYTDAVDTESSPDRYYETDIPLDSAQVEATFDDALDALGQLGVNVND